MMRFAALAISFLALCLPAVGWAQNQPPVANAGPDVSVYTSVLALLQGSATDPDGDAIIVWSWTVVEAPPGATWTLSLEDRPVARFVPYVPGDFVLSLTVVDAYYNVSLSDFVAVHAADNIPPTAVATADRTTVPVGGTVCFDGSQSSDPEGGPLGFIWNFPDGSPPVFGQAAVCHQFSYADTFNVGLQVTDERGAYDFAYIDITVTPTPLVPALSPSGLGLLGLLLSLAGAYGIARRARAN